MESGIGGFLGGMPGVYVTERRLISSVPIGERNEFIAFLGKRKEVTRSGEIVFDAKEYETWKTQR